MSRILTYYRDFEAAGRELHLAFEQNVHLEWTYVEEANLLFQQDKHQDALTALDQSLAIHPWYHPAIEFKTFLLYHLDREEETLDLLKEAETHIESNYYAGKEYEMRSEKDDLEGMLSSLARYEALSPILGKYESRWLNYRKAMINIRRGNFEEAKAHLSMLTDKHSKGVIQKICEKDYSNKRIRLNVPFVNQSHNTCVPATMASLLRYWGLDHSQEEITSEICYDGTYSHSERRWLEQKGLVVKEFTLDYSTAVTLIDNNLPFALTTVDIESAHSQAVIGYDTGNDTLLIRNPHSHHYQEYWQKKLFSLNSSSGPRGMVFVPTSQRHLLEGLALPDAALYDLYFQFNIEIAAHHREAAIGVLEKMKQLHSDHRLYYTALLNLAAYDQNNISSISALQMLRKKFPDCQRLYLSEYRINSSNKSAPERIEFLQKALDFESPHPVFYRELANETQLFSNQDHLTSFYYQKSLRRMPLSAATLQSWGQFLFQNQSFELGMDALRFSSCLEDRKNYFTDQYVDKLFQTDRQHEAINFLKSRSLQLEEKSPEPLMTLAKWQELANQKEAASETLSKALALHPGDGSLSLFCADFNARYGWMDEAKKRASQAHGKSHPAEWLRTMARLSSLALNYKEALDYWLKILDYDPTNMEAIQSAAYYMEITRGRVAAVSFSKEIIARFPYHIPLMQWSISMSRVDGVQEWHDALERSLGLFGNDPWLLREMTDFLITHGSLDDALPYAQKAIDCEPKHPFSHYLEGKILFLKGRRNEAIARYRHALTLSINAAYVFADLLSASSNKESVRDEIEFIRQQMCTQIFSGETLITFRNVCFAHVEPKRLLNILEEFLALHPMMPLASTAYAQQLIEMDNLPTSYDFSAKSLAQHPYSSDIRLTHAQICKRLNRKEEAEKTLDELVRLEPWNVKAAYSLAEFLEGANRHEEALFVIAKQTIRNPLSPELFAYESDLLWHLGRSEESLASLTRAIELSPLNMGYWSSLDWRCKQFKTASSAQSLLSRLVVMMPGEAKLKLMEARLCNTADSQNRISLILKAIELNPTLVEAYLQLSDEYIILKKWTEAKETVHPAYFQNNLPRELQLQDIIIDYRKNFLDEAIRKLEKLLLQYPDYAYAWRTLITWRMQNDQLEQADKDLASLQRNCPKYADYHILLGDLRYVEKNYAAAESAYRKALELNPGYGPAIQALYDVLLIGKNKEKIALFETKYGNWLDISLRFVQQLKVSASQNDWKNAVAQLLEITPRHTDNPDSFHSAFQIFSENNQLSLWRKTIKKHLSMPNAGSVLGFCLVESYVRQNNRHLTHTGSLIKELKKLQPESNALYYGVAMLIERIGDTRNAQFISSRIPSVIRNFKKVCQNNTQAWGNVGYAYNSVSLYQKTRKHMADWKNHPNALPWMLFNYAHASSYCGNVKEAVEICSDMISREQIDHTATSCRFFYLVGRYTTTWNSQYLREFYSLDEKKMFLELNSLKPFIEELLKLHKEFNGLPPSFGEYARLFILQSAILRSYPQHTAKIACYILSRRGEDDEHPLTGFCCHLMSWFWLYAAFLSVAVLIVVGIFAR